MGSNPISSTKSLSPMCRVAQKIVKALCFATILSALKIARFPAATAVPSRLSLHSSAKNLSQKNARAVYLYILRTHEPVRFRGRRSFGLGSPIVPVVQPSQSHMRKDAT